MNQPAPNQLSAELERLVSYTELNSSNWWRNAIDRISVAVLWLSGGSLRLEEISSSVALALGSQSVIPAVEQSIGRMVASGHLIDLPGGGLKVCEELARSLAAEQEAVSKQESVLRSRLGELFRTAGFPVADDEAWADFEVLYLVPLLHRTGAHVYELFAKDSEATESALRRSADLLTALEAKYGATVRFPLATFMDPNDAEVRSFVLRRLAGQFARGAAGLSEVELNAMRPGKGTTVRLDLFLDTNFLFSLLELHVNPNNQSSGDLIELIDSVKGRVNTRLLVLPETVEESRRVLRDVMFRLKDRSISGPIASAAGGFNSSGLVSSYIAAASKVKGAQPLSPDSFFGPYEENLLTAAATRQVNLYTSARKGYSVRQDVVDSIHEQAAVQAERRPKGAKPYEANAHDMILWHTVKDLRPGTVDTPTDARSWIVTLDYGLIAFDRHRHSRPPICITPVDLMAMLQFWVPRSDALDRAIVGALREPLLFLDFDRDVERATVNILATLSRLANADDLSAELIQSVVANKALRAGMVAAIDPASSRARTLVESAIVAEARKLEQRLNELADEKKKLAADKTDAERTLAESQAQARESTQEAAALSASLEAARLSNFENEGRLADAQRELRLLELRRSKQSTSALLGLSLLLCAGIAILVAILLSEFRTTWFSWIAAGSLSTAGFLALAEVILSRSHAFADSAVQRRLLRTRKVIFAVVGVLSLNVFANFIWEQWKNSARK